MDIVWYEDVLTPGNGRNQIHLALEWSSGIMAWDKKKGKR